MRYESNARRSYDYDFYKQIIYKINSIVVKTSKNRSRKEARLYESSSRVIVFDNKAAELLKFQVIDKDEVGAAEIYQNHALKHASRASTVNSMSQLPWSTDQPLKYCNDPNKYPI